MIPYAFTKVYGFQVDQKFYDGHRPYDYETPAGRPTPKVLLYLQNVRTCTSRRFWVLVHTGASISTLSGASAAALEISRRMGSFDEVVPLKGNSAHPVMGILRHVNVFLGGKIQKIRVAVEPDQISMRLLERKYGAGVSPCKLDILGRADILDNYLLCFNAGRLYAFRRLR